MDRSEGRPDLLVSLAPPPVARLTHMFQRTAAALLTLALALLFAFGAFLFWSSRTTHAQEDSSGRSDAESVRAGLQSLQQLASASVRQDAELAHERSERLRVEEDLHIKQLLLNRALEQKIRLGQDLHDGIIQSLYATGLTLEPTRPLVTADPAAAAARIAESTQALNRTIREVRAYINGLSPETLRRQTFSESVEVLTRDLDAGRKTRFEINIDESAAANLPEDAATDLLQVIRESVSNGLRHGRAGHLHIALRTMPGGIQLEITDNGAGFAPEMASPTGHGLENVEARVARHGGAFQIQSSPGVGTTVTATLPDLSSR